jgi:hypothetical protein
VSWDSDLTTASEHLLSAMDMAAKQHHLDEESINSACISVFTKATTIALTGRLGTSNGRSGNAVTKTVLEAFHQSSGMNRKLARELLSRAGNRRTALIPIEWLVNQLVKNSAATIQRSEVT